MNQDAELLNIMDQVVRIVAWPVVIGIVWRFRGTMDRYLTAQDVLHEQLGAAKELIAETKALVDEAMVKRLSDMSKTLQESVEQHKEHTSVLHSIDTGIKVLCDRKVSG